MLNLDVACNSNSPEHVSKVSRALPSPPLIPEEDEREVVKLEKKCETVSPVAVQSHIEPRDVAASLEKVKDVSLCLYKFNFIF